MADDDSELDSPVASSTISQSSSKLKRTTTIFMGEGIPRQALLALGGTRSSISESSSSPPPQSATSQRFTPQSASPIHPLTSLELRVRWLEALVTGMNASPPDALYGVPKSSNNKDTVSAAHSNPAGLLKKAADIQVQLDRVVQENESLRRFVGNFDEYEHILNPTFALSPASNSSSAPTYQDLTDAELDALLHEMEPELRSADRDLREIQALDKRGVTGAGKLLSHEELQPRLQELLNAQHEDAEMYASLEDRIAVLLQGYSSHVNALSDLFVYWNESVGDAEDYISKLERDHAQRERTSFE